MSHDEPEGNTKTSDSETQKHAASQCYKWQFTLKAYFHDPNDPVGVDGMTSPELVYETLRHFCKEFYYQLEEGVDGYIHYQGCFSLSVKHRLNEVKNMLGWNYIHLERAWNWHALKNYSTKNSTRVDGPWSHESNFIDTIDMDEFEEFMKEIYCIISLPCKDYRTIYWFWEPNGRVGKTSFCKWCVVHLGVTYLCSGSAKDIAYALPDHPKTIIFDFPRSMEERVPYGAIEKCKDGMVFSPKYESKTKVFNTPHIVCFANFLPDVDEMSKDRWVIKYINL